MFRWKGTLGLAVCAALASANMARGADSSLVPDQLSLADGNAAYLQATPPPPPKPLMGLLGDVGIAKALEAANINLYGYVEGGYTYSFNPPPGNKYIPVTSVFDIRQNRVVLDQADFSIERTVDITQPKFDVGGKIEMIFGTDSALIHSNGLFDYHGQFRAGGSYRRFDSPENQFDLNQAYVDLAIPVGSGLGIRLGKFDTLLGYEGINPTGNPLFSHSYLFNYAIPLTQTGILASYNINSAISVKGGITRGWNQSVDDNNGAIDFLGQIAWQATKADDITLNVSEGPQAPADNSDYWTVLDLIYTRTMSDNLNIAVNVDYGDAPHGTAGGGKSAQWYGAAAYAMLTLDPHFTLNVRGEAYDDVNGQTIPGAPAGGVRAYEATVGIAITPFPNDALGKNFQIRPEGRFDYADHDLYNGGVRDFTSQAAVDAIFTF
jgi:hypothetical protein